MAKKHMASDSKDVTPRSLGSLAFHLYSYRDRWSSNLRENEVLLCAHRKWNHLHGIQTNGKFDNWKRPNIQELCLVKPSGK